MRIPFVSFLSLSLSFVILTCHSDAHISCGSSLYFLVSSMTSYIGFLIGGSQQGSHRSCLGLLESAVTGVKGGLFPEACWEPGVTGLTWVTELVGTQRGPWLVSLQGVTQGCRSQTAGKGRSGMCSEGRCCLPPLSHGEWVSLCAGLPSPEGRVSGLGPQEFTRSQVSQEPHLELLELAGAGEDYGAWAPRSPQEALGGSCRRLHYLPGIARVHRSWDEAGGGCTWLWGRYFNVQIIFKINISTGRRVDGLLKHFHFFLIPLPF